MQRAHKVEVMGQHVHRDVDLTGHHALEAQAEPARVELRALEALAHVVDPSCGLPHGGPGGRG
jgi:hypothetical protein